MLIDNSPLCRREGFRLEGAALTKSIRSGACTIGVGNGVGSGTRAGNGSLEADSRGFDFVLRRDGLVTSYSEDDAHGSSSSKMPGTLGGRAIPLYGGDVGVIESILGGGGRRARGEGGVGGSGDNCLILSDCRR